MPDTTNQPNHPFEKEEVSLLKKVSWQVVIYSIGNVLLKFIGLLLLPLHTSVFPTSDFGILGILETTSLLLTTILSLNLSTALVRWLSDKNDIKTEKSIVFTILSLTIIILFVFSLLTFPFLNHISNLLFNTNIYKNLILLMLLGVYVEIINRIPLNLIRIKEKPILYSVAMIAKALVTLGLNIILLTHTSLGISAVLIGGIAGNLAFFGISASLLFKNINTTFLKHEVLGVLKYSFPLIFVGLGSLMLTFGDRYVLSILQNFEQVGVYTLAFKVASVVNMFVIQAVNLAV